jgi:hypothetical protein
MGVSFGFEWFKAKYSFHGIRVFAWMDCLGVFVFTPQGPIYETFRPHLCCFVSW